ncbi:MAG: O-antigen transporter [Oscillatoriales cyanobacterium CG2_30_40_61]|nr:MAG: O-antigen transporter [Oscillatoriales cyanobacterium CG2_30_40_61]
MKNLLTRLDLSYLYVFLGEATLGLTFIFYILLARVLGPQEYGVFTSASALGAILALLIQFGLPVLLNREVSANAEVGSKLTSRFILLELLTSIPVFIILFPIAIFMGYNEENTLIICYLVVFSEICRAIKMTLRGTLKGMGWFRTETVFVALERGATVVISLGVLYATKSLILVVMSIVVVRLLDILVILYYLSRKLPIWSPFTISDCWDSLRMAYPFALSGVLWILYYQVDLVMLQAIGSTVEAGYYSAAYKVMEMFFALPRVIFQVIFTRFAKYHANDPSRLPEQLYKATRLLLIGVLPAVIMAGFLQQILLPLIYGPEFQRSVYSLAILLPSLGISMFGNLAQRFLQATGQEKTLPNILFWTASGNVLINWFLIPQFGGPGAAIATLISEIALCLLGLQIMIRTPYSHIAKKIMGICLLSLFAAACPSFIIYGLNPAIGIALIMGLLLAILYLSQRRRFLGESNPSV